MAQPPSGIAEDQSSEEVGIKPKSLAQELLDRNLDKFKRITIPLQDGKEVEVQVSPRGSDNEETRVILIGDLAFRLSDRTFNSKALRQVTSPLDLVDAQGVSPNLRMLAEFSQNNQTLTWKDGPPPKKLNELGPEIKRIPILQYFPEVESTDRHPLANAKIDYKLVDIIHPNSASTDAGTFQWVLDNPKQN